jgi:CheY-like chemotaxis protein
MNSGRSPILIVEDDDAIRDALKEVLLDVGYAVECASNGKQALEILQEAPWVPSVILLDIMMPIMDGYGFRERQLSDPRFANIPTVVLSADSHLDEKSRRLMTKYFIKKPIDLEKLLSMIEELSQGVCLV